MKETTPSEMRRELSAIWKDACRRAGKVLKAAGCPVFKSRYDLSRYARYGDADEAFEGGEDAMRYFASGERGVFPATEKALEKERRRRRRSEIKRSVNDIGWAKNVLVEAEVRLAKLRGPGWRDVIKEKKA